MTFFEILENLGICLAIYLGIIFLPWVFAIFVNRTKENIIEIPLEEKTPIIEKEFSYHIDLGTELIINKDDLESLPKNERSDEGPKSSLIQKIELIEKLLKNSKTEIKTAIQNSLLKDNLIKLKHNPTDKNSLFFVIRNYYNNNLFNDCIKYAEKVLEIEENNLNAMKFIAKCYKNLGDLELASEQNLKIIKLFPEEKDTLFMLSRINFTIKKHDECISFSKRVLEIEEDNLEAMRLIARSYKKLKNNKKTEEYYLEIINKHPNDIKSLQELSRIYYNVEEYKKSIEISKEILKIDKKDIFALRLIARANNNLGNYEESLKHYLLILELNPKDIDTLSIIIRIYHKINDLQNVLHYCEKLLQFENDNKFGLSYKAKSLVKLDKLEEAIIIWEKLLEFNDNNLQALIELGQNLYDVEKYDKAVLYLERALKISGNNSTAIRILALAYDQMDLKEKALHFYILECKNSPKSISSWEKRINLLYRMDDELNAKDCLNEIIRLLGDTLEANLIALSVAISWYWEEEIIEITNKSKKRWGDDVEKKVSQIWNEHWNKEI